MTILALETATEACSVAILTDSGQLFSEFELAPRRHTQLLPSMLDSVLQQAKLRRDALTAIAFSNGPGAFTGVRIAASTAQGLAIGLGLPLIAVSTLAILAQRACDELDLDDVQATLDARMDEIYHGHYARDMTAGVVQLKGSEALSSSADFAWLDCPAVGSGITAAREAGRGFEFDHVCDERLLPSAASLAKLAQFKMQQGGAVPADAAEINYLRNQVAWRN